MDVAGDTATDPTAPGAVGWDGLLAHLLDLGLRPPPPPAPAPAPSAAAAVAAAVRQPAPPGTPSSSPAVTEEQAESPLSGPAGTAGINTHQAGLLAGTPPASNQADDLAADAGWVLVDEEPRDPDAADSRWRDLFVKYFLELDSGNDDLLFFVRDLDDPTQEADGTPDDTIFVRRKVDKAMPSLGNHVVDWKQTLFLNLIIQLPCTLTAAVCKRAPQDKGAKKQGTAGASGSASSSDPPASPPTSPPASPRTGKSRMVASQRVAKKVYAAPYKSRMDVKDAFMSECAYPLIYYTVNDYESHDLHLPVREKEYLCVELSVVAPVDGQSLAAASGASSAADAITAIPLDEDTAPFPTPPGFYKVVLFQGAVSHASLSDVFAQKSLAARTAPLGRKSWGPLSVPAASSAPSGSAHLGHRRPSHSTHGRGAAAAAAAPRTEYIMMRGPYGKGQCQVAIKEDRPGGAVGSPDDVTADATDQLRLSLSGRLRSLGHRVRVGLGAVAGLSTSPPPSSPSSPPSSPPPLFVGATAPPLDLKLPTRLNDATLLQCSMTYVNIPWVWIISDLFNHVESKAFLDNAPAE
ncbi:hypothetical protein HK405_006978 [Cladochytrium tenue]|nr:hypothetical protein HK405_006978 [Cladochytrium tenue]